MEASETSQNLIFCKNTNICRLCASKNDVIYKTIDQLIIEKVGKLLKITIDPNDSYNKICQECHNNIEAFNKFYNRIQDGQKLFNEILASLVPETIKIENIEELEATLLETNPFEELPELTKVELIELLKVEDLPESLDFGVQSSDEESSVKDDFQIEIDDTNIPVAKRAAFRNMKKDAMINNFYVFICPDCDVTLETWNDFRSHMIRDHHVLRPKYRCCEISLECERWNLLGHYYFHTSPELLKCKKCNKQFNNIRAFKKHQKETHVKTSDELKCTCPHCGITLQRKSLSQHLKLHETQQKLQCDICKMLTPTRSSLILHMKRRHLPKEEGQILCNICARSFSTKEKFNQHNRYYHDETTGKCPHCGVTKKLEHLRIHIKRVHRENKVTCEICAKEFLNKIKLKGHQLQVHVEPKFECDICLRKYKTKAKMKEHRATHFGDLRFKCDLCDHMNNDYGNMTKHRKSKHRDVPYLPHGTARKVFEIGRN